MNQEEGGSQKIKSWTIYNFEKKTKALQWMSRWVLSAWSGRLGKKQKNIKMKKTLHDEEGQKLHWEEAEESAGRGRGWGLGGGRGLVAVLRAASQTPGLENWKYGFK